MLEGRRAGRSCKLQETSLGMVLGMNNTITTKRVQCSELALDDTHQKEGSTKKGSSLNKSCGNGTVNWSRDRLSLSSTGEQSLEYFWLCHLLPCVTQPLGLPSSPSKHRDNHRYCAAWCLAKEGPQKAVATMSITGKSRGSQEKKLGREGVSVGGGCGRERK